MNQYFLRGLSALLILALTTSSINVSALSVSPVSSVSIQSDLTLQQAFSQRLLWLQQLRSYYQTNITPYQNRQLAVAVVASAGLGVVARAITGDWINVVSSAGIGLPFGLKWLTDLVRTRADVSSLKAKMAVYELLIRRGYTPEEVRLRQTMKSVAARRVRQTGLDHLIDRTNEIQDARPFMAIDSTPLWEGGPTPIAASFAKEYGGDGLGFVAEAIITEEIALGSQSLALHHDVRSALTAGAIAHADEGKKFTPIVRDLLRNRYHAVYLQTEPGAGSDVANLQMTATPTGENPEAYALNGEKYYGTGGTIAKYAVATARDPKTSGHKHLSTFLVQLRDDEGKLMPGVEIQHMAGMVGHRGTGTAAIRLSNAKGLLMGRLGRGFYNAMHTMEHGRISITSIILGCLETSVQEVYLEFRHRLERGMPESEIERWHKALEGFMADAYTTRLLLTEAARERDRGEPNNLATALAKLYGAERALANAARALALVGPEALRTGSRLERNLRDAHLLTIGEGATEVMRNIVLNELQRARPGVAFAEAVRQHPASRHSAVVDAIEFLLRAHAASSHAYTRGRIEKRLADLLSDGQALRIMEEKMGSVSVSLFRDMYHFSERIARVRADRSVYEVIDFAQEAPKDLELEISRLHRPSDADAHIEAIANQLAKKATRDFTPDPAAAGRQLEHVFSILREADFFSDVTQGAAESDADTKHDAIELRDRLLQGVARADLSLATAIVEQLKAAAILHQFHPQDELVDTSGILNGSEPAALSWRDLSEEPLAATAYLDAGGQYRVMGTKSLVPMAGQAHAFIVIAPLLGDKAPSAFLVRRENSILVTPVPTLGLRGALLGDVQFEAARATLLGERGMGDEVLAFVQRFDEAVLPALVIGSNTRLLETGHLHAAQHRKIYQPSLEDPKVKVPQPLLNFPQVREMLEDVLEFLQTLSPEVQDLADILEDAASNASRILQLHGGAGYDEAGSISARFWRDLLTLRVLYGTQASIPEAPQQDSDPSPTRHRLSRAA